MIIITKIIKHPEKLANNGNKVLVWVYVAPYFHGHFVVSPTPFLEHVIYTFGAPELAFCGWR